MSIEAMKRALDVLVALDTLFSPVARDSTQRVWINEAKESIEALRTAIQQAESEPVAVAAPHIAMGFGLYEVGSGTYQGTPCIAFGKNGTGKVGELVTMEPRQMSAEETVAVITFANAEGLDVLQEKVDEVRALHFAASSPSPWLQKPNPAPGVPDGWQLVPIEPTAEMLQAALKVTTPGALRAAWARMLAASQAQKGEA